MPSDLMTLCLSGRLTLPALASDVGLRPITPADRDALAVTYLAAYQAPTCKNVAEARQEIDDTFAGAFGTLRLDATAAAVHAGRLVGAILVTKRSIWDAHLDGPFVIDLFVHPDARGLGAGRALLARAVHACLRAADPSLSLRVGSATSPAAHALYRRAGFRQL